MEALVKERKRVYYVAGNANRKIVSLLREFDRFLSVDFIEIDKWGAAQKIKGIEQPQGYPAVLIWTDGYSHHHSFYFDYVQGGRKVVKRNIDAHSDYLMIVSKKRKKRDELDFTNHMAYSEIENNMLVQFAMPHVSEIAAFVEYSFLLEDAQMEGKINYGERQELATAFARKKADIQEGYPNEYGIHLTIDFDCISCFPSAEPKWIVGRAFSPTQVAHAVMDARETGNLLRVDMGGCYEQVPEFELQSDIDLNAPEFGLPRQLTIPAICALTNDGKLSEEYEVPSNFENGRVPKKFVDKICSYAFLCYKKVLEAVLFD